jgi:hypothetical protein
VTFQVTTASGNTRPAGTPSDTTSGLACGNRTQRDALRLTCAAWHAEGQGSNPVPPDLHLQRKDVLFGIAARSATDVWTVGTRASLIHLWTLIQHWNGTHWTVVPSLRPSAVQDLLQGVAVLSGAYAWAVGYQGMYHTLIERWNGTSWTVQPSPN